MSASDMPTLARLYFRVPPERMTEFEAAYRENVIPILKRHGLAESSERGRATVAGVFSRLFELKTPKEMLEKREALQVDPAFLEVMRELGTAFDPVRPDGLTPSSFLFLLYAAPAGPGKIVSGGPGKQVPAGQGRGHWRIYDVTDGFVDAETYSIFQDQNGYLWFGAWRGGVSQYDGQRIVTFTTKDGLADNWVRSILQDRMGHLWFGTNVGGVSRYDGETWTTFTTKDGLAHNRVLSILQDQNGHLWFGTWGGVSRYDGDTWTIFTTKDGLADNRVRSIFQDQKGNLWFGTGGGASRYDGKTPSTGSKLALPVLSTVEGSETKGQAWTTFTTKDGLADNRVLSISQDKNGYLWFGTMGGGVSRYDGETFISFTTKDGLADNDVHSILQDQGGHLWFGTWGGVSRYDGETRSTGSELALPVLSTVEGSETKGQAWTTFTTREGLVDNRIWSIYQDREGHLWFATDSSVNRYDGQIWTTFTTQDGLVDNAVYSIFRDREGNLWFGTWGGVSRYDGKTFTNFSTEDGLANNYVRSIFQDRDGHLWFGTNHGVSRYDGKTFTNLSTEDGLAENGVTSILQDREGVLWFGTVHCGASRYDGKTFANFATAEGLAHNQVRRIFQDREGYLWFATWGGISRYDGETFINFTAKDGLANDVVYDVFQDREGYFWFGTFDGVSRYDGKTFTNFTTKDGLAGNRVWSIFQDREGHLWFGTRGGGMSRYDGQVFQTMTHQDGLANNEVYSFFQDQNGYLWFATRGGVTRYRPPAPWLPPVFIDAVVADRRYEKVSELSIPSTVWITVFEFHAMSFKTRPDGMVYRYRLKGYDKDWQTTRERKVEYQDLPVGDYTFEVVAVDRDLVYSEKPATVRLTVVPDPRIEALTEALSGGGKAGEFVGKSEALRRAQAQLSEVAWTDVTVLILGETGTGKGLAARAVHALSARREGPFIQVNCGAIPEGLVESELFGHEKGAFTGAASRKLGKVEVAEGGTLFLDEIGDMPLGAQVKLLRLLEERTFERVGGTQTLRAEARVIAATNRDLKQMVSEGKFREDLYFRLQAFPVRLPPLRERREDIPQLAEYFIRRMASHLNKQVTHLTPVAFSLLSAYDWPGNVRELEHAVQRAVIVCRGPAIRAGDIVLETERKDENSSEEAVTLEEVERRHIQKVLERTGWVIRGPHGAAARLGLKESTLRFRMKKLGIRRS